MDLPRRRRNTESHGLAGGSSDEFRDWYDQLPEKESKRVEDTIKLLMLRGPNLSRPHADMLQETRISNLKELRVQSGGRPLRILFAFDPRRIAYLILGGDKTGDANWYRTYIPIAEAIYFRHLQEIQHES